MRIGIDYTAAVRQGAGIGRYTRGLIGALARLDRRNEYRLLIAGHHPPRGTALYVAGPMGGDPLARRFLERKGFRLAEAATVAEAVRRLDSDPPALVALSPTATGDDADPLRTQARRRGIPVLTMPSDSWSAHDLLSTSLTSSLVGRPPGQAQPPPGPARNPASGITAPNFTERRLPLSERWLTIAWHRLRLPLPADLFTGRVDVFHSPDFVLPPVRRGTRTLVTVHDLSFLRVPQCADAGLRAYLSQVVPRSVARADHVLADSESTKRDLIELLGTEPDKISVVPAGVEPRFRPVADGEALERVRQRYGLPRRFILSLGTLEPRKNFTALIEAFAKLGERERKLVIAGGQGWLYEDIFATIERLGLADRVVFTGFVADEDLPALYSLAELFAFPSLYEGFGLPPLEAMACGVPVVCADNSSLPEIVGRAGLLLEATDTAGLAAAMHRILADEAVRRGMVEKGLRQAQQFTWERAAERLLAVYERFERDARRGTRT